ncbi:glycoside hydrolase family 11 protein [Piromyces sp. E2]|nr:glycoside hydrolase family 11 protein [Piromyces sp. E2]|eukprot:OUM60368.1 glycoside hydrolase family 11 protein [Piromyces sp. E2]
MTTVEIDGKTYSYDDNNEAHSGFTMKQITTSWSDHSGLYEILLYKDAIKKVNPDVILLIIGTNDMTANRKMDICEYDFHTLLDYFYRDMKPEGVVVIGTIPEFREYGGTAERVANFNAVVKKVAKDYAEAGKNIKFIDTHGALDGMNDIGEDKLHPTGKGYEKMANLFYEVLDGEVLPELLDTKPTAEPPVVEPTPSSDFCAVTKHTGKSVTENDINVGSIGDIGYEIWYQGGENSATFYEDGSFTCSFKKAGDYLCRSGLSFDSTKTHEEIGHLYADFKLVKKDTEDVDYSYVGIYGWSRDPLIEYYVVDNWLSEYRPGDWVGEKKHGDFFIDGAEYTVYENTRYNAPSIDGETTFKQFFSIRREPRECGTIDITAHFRVWEEFGMKLGKLHEAKVLGEAGSIHDGTSGTADFPYAKVYIKDEPTEVVKIMPIGDSITFGLGEDGGYRKYLYKLLKDDGYKFDFVGTQGEQSATVEIDGKTYTYDDNHDAYSGFTMLQQPNSWSNDSGLYEKLIKKDAVKMQYPDVILLLIGTNDMTASREMKPCENDLHSLLDYFYRANKEVTVLLGSIPEFREYGGTAEKVANYNSVVQKVAKDYASEGKNVKFVDIHGALNGMKDIGEDKLHPSGKGYEKIAKAWYKALKKVLPKPKKVNKVKDY